MPLSYFVNAQTRNVLCAAWSPPCGCHDDVGARRSGAVRVACDRAARVPSSDVKVARVAVCRLRGASLGEVIRVLVVRQGAGTDFRCSTHGRRGDQHIHVHSQRHTPRGTQTIGDPVMALCCYLGHNINSIYYGSLLVVY